MIDESYAVPSKAYDFLLTYPAAPATAIVIVDASEVILAPVPATIFLM